MWGSIRHVPGVLCCAVRCPARTGASARLTAGPHDAGQIVRPWWMRWCCAADTRLRAGRRRQVPPAQRWWRMKGARQGASAPGHLPHAAERPTTQASTGLLDASACRFRTALPWSRRGCFAWRRRQRSGRKSFCRAAVCPLLAMRLPRWQSWMLWLLNPCRCSDGRTTQERQRAVMHCMLRPNSDGCGCPRRCQQEGTSTSCSGRSWPPLMRF